MPGYLGNCIVLHAVLSMMQNRFTNFLTCFSEPEYLCKTMEGVPWISFGHTAVRIDLAAAAVVVVVVADKYK